MLAQPPLPPPFTTQLPPPLLPPLLNSKLKMNLAISNTVMLTSTLKNTKSETPTEESPEDSTMLMPMVSSKPDNTLLIIWDSVSKPLTCQLPLLSQRLNLSLPPSTNTNSPLPQFSKVKLPSTNTLSPLLPSSMAKHPSLFKTPLRSLRPRPHILLSSKPLPLNAEGGK